MAQQPATYRCGRRGTVHAWPAAHDGDIHRLHPRPAMGRTERSHRRSRSGDGGDFSPLILFRGGTGPDLESLQVQRALPRRFGWNERSGGGADPRGVDYARTRIDPRNRHAGNRGHLPDFTAEMELEFNVVDRRIRTDWMVAPAIGNRIDRESSDMQMRRTRHGR